MMTFETIMGSEFMCALSFEKLVGLWCAVCVILIAWKVRKMSILAAAVSYPARAVEGNVCNTELRFGIGMSSIVRKVRKLVSAHGAGGAVGLFPATWARLSDTC